MAHVGRAGGVDREELQQHVLGHGRGAGAVALAGGAHAGDGGGERAGGQGHVQEPGAGHLDPRQPVGDAGAVGQAGGDRLGDLPRRAARRLGQGHRHRAGHVAHLRRGRRGERHDRGARSDGRLGLLGQGGSDRGEKGRVGHGRGAYRALVLLLAGLAVAGCSGGYDGAASTAPSQLTVTRSDDSGPVSTTDLDCAGADAAVCASVVRLLPDLRPKPDEVCTQIYGGPERIAVSGTVDGTPVQVEVTRTNGCEIARYEMLDAALKG